MDIISFVVIFLHLSVRVILKLCNLYIDIHKMLGNYFRLEKLESGSRDASEFLEWQNKMKRQDLNSKLAEIERRRIEGKLSHEEAILARQNLVEENKLKVQEMKQEVSRFYI